ncbi:hypothetical protein DF186_23540, partial [Enterococcus hirae]
MDQREKVQDPVCGMKFEPDQAVAKLDYLGETIYFCSAGFKKIFDKEPGKYFGVVKADVREPLSTQSTITLFRRLW